MRNMTNAMRAVSLDKQCAINHPRNIRNIRKTSKICQVQLLYTTYCGLNLDQKTYLRRH